MAALRAGRAGMGASVITRLPCLFLYEAKLRVAPGALLRIEATRMCLQHPRDYKKAVLSKDPAQVCATDYALLQVLMIGVVKSKFVAVEVSRFSHFVGIDPAVGN